MKGQKIFNRVDSLFQLVYYFSKLNILFIAYSFRGAILLGIFPAIYALMKIIMKGDIKEVSSRMRNDFYSLYKSAFSKANAVGWSLSVVGIIFYLNILAMNSGKVEYSLLNIIPFFTLLLLFITVSIWIFPLYVRTSLSLKNLFKYSIIIGVLNSHYTIVSFVMIFIVIYVSLLYPALLLFFAVSVSSYLLLNVTDKSMSTLDFENLVTSTEKKQGRVE